MLNKYKPNITVSHSPGADTNFSLRYQLLRKLLMLLLYTPIILFLSFVVYYIASADGSEVIRYNKYAVYFSIPRFIYTAMILFFSYYVTQRTSNGFWGKMYPTNLFMLLFLFLILPGVLLTSDFTSVGLTSFYTYLASFLLFMLGLLWVSFMGTRRKTGNKTQKTIANSPVTIYSTKSFIYILMMGLYLLGLIVALTKVDFSTSIYSELSSFMSTGNISRTLAIERQQVASRGLLDVFHSYSIIMFMPISSVFIFINGVIRGHRGQIIIGLLMALIVLIITISGGGRLRGLLFLVLIIVSYSFLNGIKLKQVINIISLTLWLLIFQTIALGRMSASSEGHTFINVVAMALNRVVERIFLTKGYCTQQVFHYIPEYTDFKWGETFLVTLLGRSIDKNTFAQEMFVFIYKGGIQGTAGPQAFGEAYANVGIAGMLIIAFLLGLLVQNSTEFVKRHMTFDAFTIVFLAYFTVLIARIGYSGIFTFKANGLHILISLYLCFIIAKKIMRKMSF